MAQFIDENSDGVSYKEVIPTGTTTILDNYEVSNVILEVPVTSPAVSIILSSALLSSSTLFKITVKDESGLASTNNITISTEGSETIDGASTYTINNNYGSITFYSSGSNWFSYATSRDAGFVTLTDTQTLSSKTFDTRINSTVVDDPSYTESANVLATGLQFTVAGTHVIPASKQLSLIRDSNAYEIGANAQAELVSFASSAASSSNANSDLYGVIGSVTNYGPGSVKALYGRAVQGAGSTGVIIAHNEGCNTLDSNITAIGEEHSHDTSAGGKILYDMWLTTNNAGQVDVDYGYVADNNIAIGQAFLQMSAVGAGALLKLNSADNTKLYYKVANDGTLTAGPWDGWSQANETWTYVSASTFTISGDQTGKYNRGDKLKWVQTTTKYGYIAITPTYNSGTGLTTVTIAVNTDYTIANAVITANWYSKADNPQSFPDWFNYTPTYGANNSMTFGSVSNTFSQYRVSGKSVTVILSATGTVGGTPSTELSATVPFSSLKDVRSAGYIDVATVGSESAAIRIATSTIYFRRSVPGNHVAGSGSIYCNITFPI